MKSTTASILVVAVVILAIICAGCSSTSSGGASQAPAAGSAPSGGGAAATPAAAPSAECPTVAATNSWAGKWDTYTNVDRCVDERKRFYPPSADIPDPWNEPESPGGEMHVPLTITQTGCSVTGSAKLEGGSVGTLDCPVTFTGTIDKDNVISGTWKAYCNIDFSGSEKTTDAGTFTLWMEPGGSTFIGNFEGKAPGISEHINAWCPSANGNWVGKRA